MNFTNFKKLWKASGADGKRVKNPVLVDPGTPAANKELAAFAKGRPSTFDRIHARKDT